MKTVYIDKITEAMYRCNDIRLLNFILKLLLKTNDST